MGLKEYIKRKRAEAGVRAEERRKDRQLQAKLNREALREDAKKARADLADYRADAKDKADIKAMKQERFKTSKTGRFIAGVDNFTKDGVKDIRSTNASMFGGRSGLSLGGGSSNDMFKGSDLGGGFGGDNFGFSKKPKPKKKKQKKKKGKSKGKSITINLS